MNINGSIMSESKKKRCLIRDVPIAILVFTSMFVLKKKKKALVLIAHNTYRVSLDYSGSPINS